jgi:hypothetical protein
VDDETKKAFESLAAEMRAGFEFLASETQAGFARVYARFDQVSDSLISLDGRMSALEATAERTAEKLSLLERRFELLEEAVSRLDRRTALFEVTLADIKDRLSRLSRDILLGRTEEAERYKALLQRLVAVEKAIEPRS